MTRASPRTRQAIWGAGAIVIVALAALALWQWHGGDVAAPAPVVAQKLEAPAAAAPSPAPAARQSAPSQAAITPAPPPPAPAAPAVAPAPPPHPQAEVPRFDIVRVDPNGNAVLAGRAAPGSEVTVHDGPRDLGHVTADQDGNWVLVPGQPLAPGQSQLSLSAKGKDRVVTNSDGVVAMLVPPRPLKPATVVAAAVPAPSAPPKPVVARVEPTPPTPPSTPAAVAKPPSPATAEAPAKTEAPPAAPAEAPIAVLLPKEGPARAMQLPPLKSKGEDRLSMDIIEYGTKGDVILQGRAAPGATVDSLLDNRKIGSATADADGKWQIVTGGDVPAGRYKLKLQSRNKAGKQVGEVTMPFERAALPAQIPADLIIVQPGNSLWRIARHSYGRGVRYLQIYHANKNQITDPKLIYPGQLLKIPEKKS
ncbi:MAG TPA: LysM peptidoglycan-binding domain-containing protein [Stellaceae bacterium]